MALVLYRPLFWFLAALLVAVLLWLGRRRSVRWWPAWAMRLLLIVAALFGVFFPQGELLRRGIPQRQIMLIDQSDSIPAGVRDQVQVHAMNWQSAAGNRMVIVYGNGVQPRLTDDEAWPEVDGTATDLVAALELSVELLGPQPGKIILASDGAVASIPPVNEAVNRLTALGHTLDFVPLETVYLSNDIYVGHLWAPTGLWEQTPFTVVLPVYMPRGGEVTLRLDVNGQTHVARTESLNAGENYVAFGLQARETQIITLQASALTENDPRLENNLSYATVHVYPAPRVLIVTQEPQIAGVLGVGLIENGIPVDMISPAQVPVNLEGLDPYQVIFLHNFLADHLSSEQMRALTVFVSQRGRGLIFLGGRNSYTLGGYQDTILETILPVKLEPPSRGQQPPVTFLLVMDRSGSMGRTRQAIRPMDLAREAAMRVIDTLSAEDYLGVVTYSDRPTWALPIRQVGDGLLRRQAQDAVSQVQASGGTAVYSALKESLDGLRAVGILTETRHVLLLSDGRSSDGTLEQFQELVEQARAEGITISTIALGREADQALMANIAEWGGGRYYFVLSAEDLPQVMVSESKAARSENVQLGETNLISVEGAHPILFGLSLSDLPRLSGYNALISKSDRGAEDILLSANFSDPLLSAWQVGLGRVIAWMGDTGEDWAGRWTTWPKFGYFWAQVVRYTLPDPAFGPAQVDVHVDAAEVTVTVRILDTVDRPVNLAQVEFRYVNSEGIGYAVPVSQVEPGLYETSISLPEEGAYRAVVQYQGNDGMVELPASFVVDYPHEWQLADPQIGFENLVHWATITGGGMADLLVLAPSDEVLAQREVRDILWWMLLAIVVLWPVEIAVRRRWLPWN